MNKILPTITSLHQKLLTASNLHYTPDTSIVDRISLTKLSPMHWALPTWPTVGKLVRPPRLVRFFSYIVGNADPGWKLVPGFAPILHWLDVGADLKDHYDGTLIDVMYGNPYVPVISMPHDVGDPPYTTGDPAGLDVLCNNFTYSTPSTDYVHASHVGHGGDRFLSFVTPLDDDFIGGHILNILVCTGLDTSVTYDTVPENLDFSWNIGFGEYFLPDGTIYSLWGTDLARIATVADKFFKYKTLIYFDNPTPLEDPTSIYDLQNLLEDELDSEYVEYKGEVDSGDGMDHFLSEIDDFFA